MNDEQKKCIEEIKAACDYALSGAITYEAAIERIGSQMDTCPEP